MPAFPLLDPVWWNWYLAGVILISLEVLVPGVFILWFGLGALITGGIVQMSGGFYWPYQVILFALLSLISLAVGRRVIRQARPASRTTLNHRLHSYLGRQTSLDTPLVNGKGRIKLDGTYWLVKGPDLPAGTTVTVTGVEDSFLVLAKITL